MQTFCTQPTNGKTFLTLLIHGNISMKCFFYLFGLLLLNSSLAKAQCPTSIFDSDGDGTSFVFYLDNISECSNYPAPYSNTFPINSTAGTGNYDVYTCQTFSGHVHAVGLVYKSGVYIILAGDAPITITVNGILCTYNSAGLLLPIELIAFDAQTTDQGKTHLFWTTASEHNNQGFEIEKSTDGRRFEKIGFVEGKGTTTTTQTYAFEDNTPNKSISYYRLRQLDFDGQSEYSKIISINGTGKTEVRIFPNPSNGFFNILGLEDTDTKAFTLINSFGQTVDIQVQNDGQVDMLAYPTGVYYLRVESSGQVIRLVKE